MVESLFTRLMRDAAIHNHRRLLVISGSHLWCLQQVKPLVEKVDITISDSFGGVEKQITSSQSHKLLGKTLSSIIFDAWSGFNPNRFGQVSGTIGGGGVLVLLCPDLDEWPAFDDPEHAALVASPYTTEDVGRRFISRIAMLLEDDAYTVICRESKELAGVEIELPELPDTAEPQEEAILPNKTPDQQKAVELILSQFRRGRRPVVLTADRGRGKSVALGIAAAQLSGLDFEQILVTAPEFETVEELFAMAGQLLPDYQHEKGSLHKGQHSIRYLSPEKALQESGGGKVLLVDEAAAIPVPILSALLERFPRIAFASTVHGYEGTGQGFSLRFKKVLNTLTPKWKGLHLKQPIRWSDNDPLERLVFNLLLLNAEASECSSDLPLEDSELSVRLLDRDQLAEDYQTLSQLFGLLTLAHYRTTPGDLRILLDSPNLYIWLLRSNHHVIGAVLVSDEGPLPAELIEKIWAGERRPRGHLLPQALVCQEGALQAASLKAGRVMRIAVHPVLHRKGLGTKMLQYVIGQSKQMGWDYLGSSYAANPELQHFWHQNGFDTVRIGSVRDSISGNHAALVMCALNEQGKTVQTGLRERFIEQLNYRLSDDLVDLEVAVVCRLLQHAGFTPVLTPHDKSDLKAFAYHNRSYESCAFAIHKLLLRSLDKISDDRLLSLLGNPDFQRLVERNLQQKSWSELDQAGTGRKQMMRQFRSVVEQLLDGEERLNV